MGRAEREHRLRVYIHVDEDECPLRAVTAWLNVTHKEDRALRGCDSRKTLGW